MKMTTKLVREIEHAQAKIAVLREEHARTGQELSHWIGIHKNKVMELVGATVERLDLSQMPIHDLLSSLSRLALQLPFMQVSESMGNHDSKIVDAASVD